MNGGLAGKQSNVHCLIRTSIASCLGWGMKGEKDRGMVKTWLFGPSSGKNSAVAYSYRRVSVGGQGPRAVSLLDDRTCRCQTSGQPGFHDITSRQTPPPPSPQTFSQDGME